MPMASLIHPIFNNGYIVAPCQYNFLGINREFWKKNALSLGLFWFSSSVNIEIDGVFYQQLND